jgi:hypothetical protein
MEAASTISTCRQMLTTLSLWKPWILWWRVVSNSNNLHLYTQCCCSRWRTPTQGQSLYLNLSTLRPSSLTTLWLLKESRTGTIWMTTTTVTEGSETRSRTSTVLNAGSGRAVWSLKEWCRNLMRLSMKRCHPPFLPSVSEEAPRKVSDIEGRTNRLNNLRLRKGRLIGLGL